MTMGSNVDAGQLDLFGEPYRRRALGAFGPLERIAHADERINGIPTHESLQRLRIECL